MFQLLPNFSKFQTFLGIPAILPIVEYIYVLKSAFMVNSSDLKELEAQREMLFAMLLRLCQFNEVCFTIYNFTVILNNGFYLFVFLKNRL